MLMLFQYLYLMITLEQVHFRKHRTSMCLVQQVVSVWKREAITKHVHIQCSIINYNVQFAIHFPNYNNWVTKL